MESVNRPHGFQAEKLCACSQMLFKSLAVRQKCTFAERICLTVDHVIHLLESKTGHANRVSVRGNQAYCDSASGVFVDCACFSLKQMPGILTKNPTQLTLTTDSIACIIMAVSTLSTSVTEPIRSGRTKRTLPACAFLSRLIAFNSVATDTSFGTDVGSP